MPSLPFQGELECSPRAVREVRDGLTMSSLRHELKKVTCFSNQRTNASKTTWLLTKPFEEQTILFTFLQTLFPFWICTGGIEEVNKKYGVVSTFF
jgi:hypothetical protein